MAPNRKRALLGAWYANFKVHMPPLAFDCLLKGILEAGFNFHRYYSALNMSRNLPIGDYTTYSGLLHNQKLPIFCQYHN